MPLTYARHHTIFERKWYQTLPEKAFRNHLGLVVPLYNELHFEVYPQSLHNNVEPPVKPETRHILGALSLMEGLRLKIVRRPLQLIPHLADYFDRVGEPIGENLRQQLPYIERGIVK